MSFYTPNPSAPSLDQKWTGKDRGRVRASDECSPIFPDGPIMIGKSSDPVALKPIAWVRARQETRSRGCIKPVMLIAYRFSPFFTSLPSFRHAIDSWQRGRLPWPSPRRGIFSRLPIPSWEPAPWKAAPAAYISIPPRRLPGERDGRTWRGEGGSRLFIKFLWPKFSWLRPIRDGENAIAGEIVARDHVCPINSRASDFCDIGQTFLGYVLWSFSANFFSCFHFVCLLELREFAAQLNDEIFWMLSLKKLRILRYLKWEFIIDVK